jgi:hypothetical protein
MPQLGGEALLLDQATAYERALQAFFADCAARPGCPLASAGDPAAAYDELMAKIEREGVPAPAMGNRRVGPAEAESTIPAMLTVGEPVWPALATLLSRAARGDASGMLAVSDAVNMALDAQANSAIACSDLPLAPSQGLQGVPPLVERARQVAPHFLFAVNGSATACATWPIHPGRPPSLRAKGAPPSSSSEPAATLPPLPVGRSTHPTAQIRCASQRARVFAHFVCSCTRRFGAAPDPSQDLRRRPRRAVPGQSPGPCEREQLRMIGGNAEGRRLSDEPL